jgi:hypothetical protein
MRIKAKIAFNHEIGSLPRGAVIEETAKRGKALVDSGKFTETTEEVTHRAAGAKAKAAAEPVDKTA